MANYELQTISCFLRILVILSMASQAYCYCAPIRERYYPSLDKSQEKLGIYTGEEVPQTFMVFNTTEKEFLKCIKRRRRICYAWDYVTKPARNDVPIACENISEQTDCQKATWGTQQLEEYANQSFMAVWTFTVPAKKCVNIQFNISNFTKDDDRLFVKFSDGLDPVHMHQEELFSINRMAMNRTVISIFFSYRSLQFPRMHFTFKLTNLDCSCEPPNISLNN